MTPALPSSTPVPEVRSEGGSAPAPRPGLGLGLGLGKLPAARYQPAANFNFNLNLNGSRPLRGRAFSLVELLAVVGIIAMLSVAAVPVMRGLGGSQSSRATAQILVSALEQARTAAILSGTNAYLVLPDANFPATNYRFVSYAILRPPVDLDANNRDDFQTNVSPPNWVLLSKWERLPGDLRFSSALLSELAKITPINLPAPGGSNATQMPMIGFTPSGSLTDDAGTNGLLFASSAKVTNGTANVADQVQISRFSGRVRYAGVVTNTNF